MDTGSAFIPNRGPCVDRVKHEDVVALMTPGGHDLLGSLRRPSWMAHAACKGQDPATFVPASSPPAGGPPKRIAEVCARCPVAPECLQYALERPELLGVWGGSTEAQRKLLRRSLAA